MPQASEELRKLWADEDGSGDTVYLDILGQKRQYLGYTKTQKEAELRIEGARLRSSEGLQF